jgi:hypothetical protein
MDNYHPAISTLVGSITHKSMPIDRETYPRLFGQVKLAADKKKSKLPLLAAGAAGVAPLAGMIGQKPLLHDPYLNKKIDLVDYNKLQGLSQPGDVLITSMDSGRSPWQSLQSPFSGTEFYHAQPAIKDPSGKMRTMTAGELSSGGKSLSSAAVKKKLRTNKLDTFSQLANQGEYGNQVLLRPKKSISPEQAKRLNALLTERAATPYGGVRGASAYLKDLFLPKIKGVTDKIPDAPNCVGDVCSTLPSRALKEVKNIDVVPGKSPGSVLPHDFLRSEEFEPVAAALARGRKRAPFYGHELRNRALLGAGLAAGTYGALKHPLAAGSLAAGAGASSLIEKLLPHMPDRMQAIEAIQNGLKNKGDQKILQQFLLKNLGPSAALAGGTYLGGKAILDRIKARHKSSDSAQTA